MRRFHFVRLSAIVAVAVIEVFLSPRRASAIVGGEFDGDEHPHVGALIFVNPPADRPNLDVPRVRGTGTLVHPRIVLTAGQQTSFLEGLITNGLATLDDFRVSFGSDAFQSDAWLEISDVITHPEFRQQQNNGNGTVPLVDVGALILKHPMLETTPAALPPLEMLDSLLASGSLQAHPEGTPLTVVGYGSTEVHPAGTSLTPPDGLRRFASSAFHNLHNEWLQLSQNFSQSEGGSGFGDAGGPTFWMDPDSGAETIVSITSRGDFALASTGLSYRADISATLDFSDWVIARVEAGEFDAVALSAVSVVPEPASLVMCAISAFAISFQRMGMRQRRTNKTGR